MKTVSMRDLLVDLAEGCEASCVVASGIDDVSAVEQHLDELGRELNVVVTTERVDEGALRITARPGSETNRPRAVVILKSSNIGRTMEWYTKAGFKVRGSHPATAPMWCEIERTGTVIQFLAGETPWPGQPAFTGCVYVHCDDVDAVHAELQDKIQIEWGVEDREWDARELVVRDPDGYFITFTQPTPDTTAT